MASRNFKISTEHHNKGRGMRVSNNQKSGKEDNSVSRETLNDWQRKDAAKNAAKANHREAGAKEPRKQAENQSRSGDS
jgi:hypothetical protein